MQITEQDLGHCIGIHLNMVIAFPNAEALNDLEQGFSVGGE